MFFNHHIRSLEEQYLILCISSIRNESYTKKIVQDYSKLDLDRLWHIACLNKVEKPLASTIVNMIPSNLVSNSWKKINSENIKRVEYMDFVSSLFFQRLEDNSVKAALFESAGVLYCTDLPWDAYGSGDFDVLVEQSGLSVAASILCDLGIKPVERTGRALVERQEFYGTTPDGQTFWIDVGCKPFERAKFALNYDNPAQIWLSRRIPSRKNSSIYTLKPEDLLAQVSIHTSLHSYVRSPGLRLHMDVDRVVSDNRISWHLARNEIKILSFENRSFYSFKIAHDELSTCIPSYCLESRLLHPLSTFYFAGFLSKYLIKLPERNVEVNTLDLILLEFFCKDISPLFKGIKYYIDRIAAFVGIVVLSPILLTVSLAILITMGRPIFFRQLRPGFNNKLFMIYKFRTMNNPIKDDPDPWYRSDKKRLTPLGLFLRKSSIDELPELFNVLKGDMSFVGPRPLLQEYLSKYTNSELIRHTVKPGITGLAQVRGRQHLPFSNRLHLDVCYALNWSAILDLKILFCTFSTVFFGHGVISGQDLDSIDDIGLSADVDRIHIGKDSES